MMFRPRVELWLELETGCNLSCKFCYNYWKDGSAPEPGRLSSAETLGALRRLFEAVECSQIAFSGGEPLLRSDLLDLVRLARSYAIPAILTTNGLLLTAGRIRELQSAGIGTYQIPFHSHMESVHDDLSGGRCWRSSLAAMLRVRESGASLVPVFVATRQNAGHFARVIEILSHIGVRRIIFNRFIPTGRGALLRDQIGVPGDRELGHHLTEADQAAREYGIRIQLGTPIEVPPEAGWTNIDLASCPVEAGQRRWTISSNMSIRRCNQSAGSIGSLLGDGIERLLAELSVPARKAEGEVRPCGILAQQGLVRIRTGEYRLI